MTNEVENKEVEPKANPYNQKKHWHTPDVPSKGSADSLFFDDSVQATSSNEAPVEEETKEKKQKSNYKKRYDDLKKHYDEKVANFKQREAELEAAANSGLTSDYTPPKTIEDLTEFKEKYPDLYETVETVAHQRTEEQTKALKEQLTVLQKREQSIARKEAEATLQEKHPDFNEIRQDDNFHAWAETQPEQIQGWIYKNPDNVQLAIKAIDLYKLENGLTVTKSPKSKSNKSQSSGSAADMVSTRTTSVDAKEPKVWTQREINALSMDDYDKYEKDIDQAIMEGRVVS